MPEDTEKVEKAETQPVEEKPAEEIVETEEEFDKDRAMNTIKNLRKFEKEVAKLQKELDAYKQQEDERKKAELSEIDRLKLEKQEADQKLAELMLEKQRREAAEKVGLPAIFADRVKGETLDEMEEDAKKLLDGLPKSKSTVSVTNPGPNASDQKETRAEQARRLGLTY